MPNSNFMVRRDELKVIMERVFDAPRDLVFKAFTDSKLISNWWGPRGSTTIVDKNELKKGGGWRFVVRGSSGKEDAFSGKYLEIDSPTFVSHTFNYEPIGPGHELVESASFEKLEGGRTRLTTVSEYNAIEELEGMVGAGMEKGATESYDRLGELLETIKKAEE